MDSSVESVLGKAAPVETQVRMAEALRQRLVKSTEPEDVPYYEILWGWNPDARQPDIQSCAKAVAADLARLEKTFPAR